MLSEQAIYVTTAEIDTKFLTNPQMFIHDLNSIPGHLLMAAPTEPTSSPVVGPQDLSRAICPQFSLKALRVRRYHFYAVEGKTLFGVSDNYFAATAPSVYEDYKKSGLHPSSSLNTEAASERGMRLVPSLGEC